MKYLRKFNENDIFSTKDTIIDFCETQLAYLVDEGLLVGSYEYENSLVITLDNIFKPWKDVKDQLIPFFIRLKADYETDLYHEIAFNMQSKGIELDIDDVIADGENYPMGKKIWNGLINDVNIESIRFILQ